MTAAAKAPKWRIEKLAGGWLLAGSLSEDSDFSALAGVRHEAVALYLDQVTRINSSGIRQWMDALSGLQARGCKVSLHRCSPEVVYQLNYLRSFAQGAQVTSILLPYFCEACDQEKLLPYDMAEHRLENVPDKRPCPTCQTEMTFGDAPDTYFTFVNGAHA